MMMKTVVAFLLAVSATSVYAASVKIPKLPWNHVPCFQNDPLFDTCFQGSLQNLLRAFSKEGAPELNLKPFDPLHVPQMLVEYEQDRITGKLLVKDSLTSGFSNIRVNGVKSNFANKDKFEMEIDIQFPSVFIEGSYESEGNIVFFPINGGGKFNISMRDISGKWKMSGTPLTKDGKNFVKIEHFLFRPKVGFMKIYASNLFTGNEALSNAALAFANNFWPAIYDELVPYAEQAWDKVMTDFANQIFLKVPFDELFPIV